MLNYLLRITYPVFGMNERGAILPSVLVFVLLMMIMLLGTNRIFENQMHQLRMTKHYYKVESMLILSEMELKDQYELNKEFKNGRVIFSDGTVAIQKKDERLFSLNGTLKTIFSKQLEVQLKKQSIENSTNQEPVEDATTFKAK